MHDSANHPNAMFCGLMQILPLAFTMYGMTFSLQNQEVNAQDRASCEEGQVQERIQQEGNDDNPATPENQVRTSLYYTMNDLWLIFWHLHLPSHIFIL